MTHAFIRDNIYCTPHTYRYKCLIHTHM